MLRQGECEGIGLLNPPPVQVPREEQCGREFLAPALDSIALGARSPDCAFNADRIRPRDWLTLLMKQREDPGRCVPVSVCREKGSEWIIKRETSSPRFPVQRRPYGLDGGASGSGPDRDRIQRSALSRSLSSTSRPPRKPWLEASIA